MERRNARTELLTACSYIPCLVPCPCVFLRVIQEFVHPSEEPCGWDRGRTSLKTIRRGERTNTRHCTVAPAGEDDAETTENRARSRWTVRDAEQVKRTRKIHFFYACVTRPDAVTRAHRCGELGSRWRQTIYERYSNVKIPQVHDDVETVESPADREAEGGGGEEPPRISLPPRQKPRCGGEIRPTDKWLQVPPHWSRMKKTHQSINMSTLCRLNKRWLHCSIIYIPVITIQRPVYGHSRHITADFIRMSPIKGALFGNSNPPPAPPKTQTTELL